MQTSAFTPLLLSSGHTFPSKAETFLPRFRLDNKSLVFPAVNVYEAAYRTVLLENVGPTPIYYAFDQDSTGYGSCSSDEITLS